jgi:hypothetical protein
MANRFQINQHRMAYCFIASRDGEYCLICKRGPGKVKLQIDHADNNPSNWEPDNLHLLCQTHNLQLRSVPVAKKLRTIRWHSAKNVCVRERRYGSISTKVAKDTLEYRSGSVEMKANSMFEPVFTEWLLQNLPMPKSEAIYSGAQIAGCNPVTCERYLKKLTSAAGPLNEFRDDMGTATIDFKPDLKQAPTDSLEPSKLRGRGATANTVPERRRNKWDGRVTGPAKLRKRTVSAL